MTMRTSPRIYEQTPPHTRTFDDQNYQYRSEDEQSSLDEHEEEEQQPKMISLNQKTETTKQKQKTTGRRIQKIPSVWLRKCPIQKINKNLQQVISFERSQKLPKIAPMQQKYLCFANQQEEQLFLQRASVAKFILIQSQKKRNMRNLLHSEKMNEYYDKKQEDLPKNFKTISETVLTQTCRRLETFLLKELKIRIAGLSRLQYKEIFTALVNFTNFFKEDLSETFRKFIKLAFRLEVVKFSGVLPIIKLYKSIQLAVKISVEKRLEAIAHRRGSSEKLTTFRQLTFKTQLKKIWNYEFEKLLLKSYSSNQNFGYIRSVFQNTYPTQASVFTSSELKDRFLSIIRMALKMVRDRIKQEKQIKIPKLFGLNEKRFKQIVKTKRGLDIRLWLIDLYTRKNKCPKEEIVSIVSVMNDFINSRENYSVITSELTSRRDQSEFQNINMQSEQSNRSNEENENQMYFEENDFNLRPLAMRPLSLEQITCKDFSNQRIRDPQLQQQQPSLNQ